MVKNSKTIVVACAGKGTRMGELTKNTPKPLIEVCGKPFIYFLLKNIQKAGFERIIIVVGYKKEAFARFAQEYASEFKLGFVDQNSDATMDKYGTAIPVLVAEKLIGNQNFVYAMGDNYYGVNDLMAAADSKENTVFVTSGDTSRYGTFIADERGMLCGMKGKSEEPQIGIINSALYVFKPEIFAISKQIPLSPRGEYRITDALLELAKDKKVKLETCRDDWLDFGRPEDIKVVEKYLLSKQKNEN